MPQMTDEKIRAGLARKKGHPPLREERGNMLGGLHSELHIGCGIQFDGNRSVKKRHGGNP